MKITLTMFFIIVFIFNVSAQEKMTDSEFYGMKGSVKSVLTEYIIVGENNKPHIESHYFYDRNGRLAEVLYPDTNHKVIFTNIDGFKTFKSSKISDQVEENKKGIFRVAPVEDPNKKNNKLVPPDKRFDEKFTYEYDSSGRVKTESEYLNNGELIVIKTFLYDDKSKLIEETEKFSSSINKINYTYDEKGNLIKECLESSTKSQEKNNLCKYKTIYSDYKVDQNGNWIERKYSYQYEINGIPKVREQIYYRKIFYY